MARFYESRDELLRTLVLPMVVSAGISGLVVVVALQRDVPHLMVAFLIAVVVAQLAWPLRPKRWQRAMMPARMRNMTKAREYAYVAPQVVGMLVLTAYYWDGVHPGDSPAPAAVAIALVLAPVLPMYLLEFDRTD